MSVATTIPRLASVLGLLSSSHDGEVLAAARAAERIRQQMGASWGDLLGQPAPARPWDWQEMVAACRAQADRLTAWEVDFLNVLASYSRAPSQKQAVTLGHIAARVL